MIAMATPVLRWKAAHLDSRADFFVRDLCWPGRHTTNHPVASMVEKKDELAASLARGLVRRIADLPAYSRYGTAGVPSAFPRFPP